MSAMNLSTTESTEITERKENDSLTGEIIGAAIEFHKKLGSGLLESAYEACLAYELRLTHISHSLSGNLDKMSRHLRPQMPSSCRFDNVLRHLRTNLTQHLAQLASRFCEKCGLGYLFFSETAFSFSFWSFLNIFNLFFLLYYYIVAYTN